MILSKLIFLSKMVNATIIAINIMKVNVEPKGQLYPRKKRLVRALPNIIPSVPPTSVGVKNSPTAGINTKRIATKTPGMLRGKVTSKKLCIEFAPKSSAASRSALSIFSKDTKIG